MHNFLHGLVRTSAFFRKEIVEIIRQPRLVLTLILGPFLILLLFGLGYRNEPRVVTALFVADPNSNINQSIQEYATSLGDQLHYAGTISDEREAIDRLWKGQVDLVVVVPPNPEQSIENDQPATITLYHNEIDPAQVAYIQSLGQIYVDEVNRRVVSQMVVQAQTQSQQVKDDISSARDNARLMREALQAGNVNEARNRQQMLSQNLQNLNSNASGKALLLDSIQNETGTSGAAAGGILALLGAIQQSPSVSQQVPDNQTSYQSQIDELTKTEQQLADLQNQLTVFDRISPDTMVRPFRTEVTSIAPRTTQTPMNFYAPAVVALLLQHIAVTFGALSIVRERTSGMMELFRVSPIASGEELIGKYISYLVFGAFIGGVLILLLYFGLKVPIIGLWYNVALVVLAVLFTSLGLGFLISLLAHNESQAVQLSMITLLVSVFFSGLFLDLRYLWKPVQIVSWITPATYGTVLLQNIMLRGYGIGLVYITGLLILGFSFFILSWILLQRQLKLG